MARARSPNRDRAFEMWRDSGGTMKLKDLAAAIGEPDSKIRKWKTLDEWDTQLEQSKGSAPLPQRERSTSDEKERSQTKGKRGAPPGNQNAKGHGAPKDNQNAVGNRGPRHWGNDHAVTHGFFRKYFPDDEETQELLEEVDSMTAADILWINIKAQFMAIIRAQKTMFVEGKHEMIKELKKRKVKLVEGRGEGEVLEMPEEEEWEFQFAWDRHATQMTAQSRAMSELRSLIKQFMEVTGEDDKRRLELATMEANLEKTRAEIEKIKSGEGDGEGVQIIDDIGDDFDGD